MKRGELDSDLRPMLRQRIDLPVTSEERTLGDERRRLVLIILVGDAVLVAIIFLILLRFGALPSIHVDPKTTIPPGYELKMWKLMGAIFSGFLVFGAVLILSMTGFRKKDPAGKPWRYEASETTFSIITAEGGRYSDPWAAWRLVDYGLIQYRNKLISVKWLRLERRGERFLIDLVRCRRPHPLTALLLQRTTEE